MSMRIALVAPPYLTVPPSDYGGIEQVVALLADGLSERSHDVTLLASGGSHTKATVTSPFAAPGAGALGNIHYGLAHVLDVYDRADEFDIVHDHTTEGPALAAVLGRSGVVHTLHGPWTDAAAEYYRRIDGRVHLVAISHAQKERAPAISCAGVVPNGIDVDQQQFRSDKEEYLVFVGRSSPDKGPELAVEVAKRAGRPLVMIVKRAEEGEQRHWAERVVPRLTGTETIMEHVPHAELSGIVAGAAAMVFPIQWEEPFGLVIIEAMAAGTPVITRPVGAAPELVRDGITGFLCDTIEDMVAAVDKCGSLSAEACREHVVRTFSKGAMVRAYESLYEDILAGTGRGVHPAFASPPRLSLMVSPRWEELVHTTGLHAYAGDDHPPGVPPPRLAG